MERKRIVRILLAGFVVASVGLCAKAEQPVRKLPLSVFQDKMQGAWLGQMIGVGWGAPTEFKVKGEIIPEDKMPLWKPEMVNQHDNDDCYVEMTFMKTLETYGFDASIRQAGIDFANSGYKLWHANTAGRENLRKGIAPPDSGHPQFNKCADDIDYQIEADYSGIIAPGLPNLTIALGQKFGRLMNYGDGLYAGQFIGGMYAEAYFESDPWKLVAAGLQCMPADSDYAGMVRDLTVWCRQNADWTKTWDLVEAKYHKDPRYTHDLCSKPGGTNAFSIDAKLNGAYVIMGLLYGAGDPDKTIAIACRCGQDSDCNPANAAGVLFAAMGASKIPARFTEKLDLMRKYSFTDYTLPQVYEVSEKLVRQAVTRIGGRIEKDANGAEVFVIPVQTPNPGKAEKSYEPGPIVNSRFTVEEMARIKPDQTKAKK
ncbi:MAG: ADP-ribosylglycohydrolase family protein [Verrucomicrobiota bacterium]